MAMAFGAIRINLIFRQKNCTKKQKHKTNNNKLSYNITGLRKQKSTQ